MISGMSDMFGGAMDVLLSTSNITAPGKILYLILVSIFGLFFPHREHCSFSFTITPNYRARIKNAHTIGRLVSRLMLFSTRSSHSLILDVLFQRSHGVSNSLTAAPLTPPSIEDKSESDTSIAEQSAAPVRNPLDVVTSVINNLMASSEPPKNRRKRMIERPFGESLTSMEAILKINNKENQTKKRKANANTTKKPTSDG
jgi:hypothetical protein